jgi:hypothetical protein
MTQRILNITTETTRKIDKVTFFGLFTESERAAYFEGLNPDTANVNIQTVDKLLTLAPWEMETTHSAIQAGLYILLTEGVISPERIAEISAQL